MSRHQVWKLALVTATALPLAAACGSSKKNSTPTTTAPGITSTTLGGKTTSPTYTSARNVPQSVPNAVPDRKAVSLSSCSASAGGWTASGTVANPGTAAKSYQITIFFTTSHATVEAFGSSTTSVDAGKTVDWKVTAPIASPDPDTSCVLRGVS